MDGWYEVVGYHCYACSELRGEPTTYDAITLARDLEAQPLTVFDMAETTYSPPRD